MNIPIVSDLIKNTVGKAVDGLVNKYLPASASETEKQNFKLEMEKLLTDQEKAFRESVNAYENPAGLSAWMLNYRASVRPNITYAAFLLLVYIVGFGGNINWENLKQIPSEIWWMFLAIFGFWFGGRAWSDAQRGKG